MSTGSKVSIIIPVYNEKHTLEELFTRLQAVFAQWPRDHEFIFIDDGCTDGSTEILLTFPSRDPHARLIRFKRNFGQKAGMAAGFQYATGEIMVILDSDLQIDPENIPKLIEKLEEGYDLVSGLRLNRPENLWIRRIPSLFTNLVYKWVLKVPHPDIGCGFQAIRRKYCEYPEFQNSRWSHLAVYVIWRGARFTTIPIQFHPRPKGETKYNLIALVHLFMDVLITFNIYPVGLALATLAGLSGAAIGLAMLAVYLIGHLVGVSMSIAWPFFGILLGATGFNMVLFGIINERMNRMDRQLQKEPIYVVDEVIEGAEANADPS